MMLHKSLLTAILLILSAAPLSAQQPSATQDSQAAPVAAADSPVGMYSFLREGEFVQLTVEDGKLSGFISRFGDSSSDKGAFINQFFDKTSLNGDRLTFTTKTVHGVWYDFAGTVNIVPGKKPAEEGYRVLQGTLTQHTSDVSGTGKAMQRKVEFKSFPPDLGRP
jgi:hypothetical protein